MEPAWAKGYTEEDYYKLPEEVRAELIDGQFYYMAVPSRIHQKILMELSGTIRDYLKARICSVRPRGYAPNRFNDSAANISSTSSLPVSATSSRKRQNNNYQTNAIPCSLSLSPSGATAQRQHQRPDQGGKGILSFHGIMPPICKSAVCFWTTV